MTKQKEASMRCKKCGSKKIKHQSISNFGDPALGVATEWLECGNCSARHTMDLQLERSTLDMMYAAKVKEET